MKIKKLTLVLLTVLMLLFTSTITFAANETADDVAAISETPTTTTATEEEHDHDHSEEATEGTTELDQHNGNYFETGDAITIDKAINGNAFVMGTTVNVTGQIYGDLFVIASESLDIQNGAGIAGNVFAVSPKITLNGLLYNLYAIADTFNAGYDALIALDIKLFANKIDFSGYIERSVYFYASDSITLTKDAYILGNCVYSAPNVDINEEAIVMGEKIESDFAAADVIPSTGVTVATYISSFITTLAFTLVVLLVLLLSKPKYIEKATTNLFRKPLKTFGIGLLSLIIVPIVALLCTMLTALAPFGVLLFALYFIVIALSTIIVTIVLAKKLDSKIQKTQSELSILAYVLIVAAVLWALVQIPVISMIVSLIVVIFGFGIVVTNILPSKEEKPVVEAETEKVEEPKKEEVKQEKADKKEDKKEEKQEEKKEDKKDKE